MDDASVEQENKNRTSDSKQEQEQSNVEQTSNNHNRETSKNDTESQDKDLDESDRRTGGDCNEVGEIEDTTETPIEIDSNSEEESNDVSTYKNESTTDSKDEKEVDQIDLDKKEKTYRVGKWKVKKLTLKVKGHSSPSEDNEFPQSTYIQRQRQKQNLDDPNVPKDVKLEKIYIADHKPKVIVQLLPNKEYVPKGYPRKPTSGSMPKLKNRFRYTNNAYGNIIGDKESKKPVKTKEKKRKQKQGDKSKNSVNDTKENGEINAADCNTCNTNNEET